jgi:lipid II:glycine glycyltransferase (peptidoglycan interpeptide bridge formation enzyme)
MNENLTVGIDLTLPEEKQIKQYARSFKYRINRLKKSGVCVIRAENKEEIDSFIALYEENMKRVNAPKMYFFPREYFYRFLEKIDSILLLAVYEHQIIAGALCTFCRDNMQYHLGATKNDFLFMSPIKLVLDEARREGMSRKMRWLHLGGGRGGVDDSLFVFKSRFSNQRFVFKTWRYIHNKAVYDTLIYNKYKENIPEITFFPLYRA